MTAIARLIPGDDPPVLSVAGSAARAPSGLSASEASRRLKAVGPNAMPDTTAQPWRLALGKLWAPVPWMLEAAIVLQLVLGDYAEASIIAGLLVLTPPSGCSRKVGRRQR